MKLKHKIQKIVLKMIPKLKDLTILYQMVSIEKDDTGIMRKIDGVIVQVCSIQFQKMNMDHLLNKPYVNEVTLTEQNLSLKMLLVSWSETMTTKEV